MVSYPSLTLLETTMFTLKFMIYVLLLDVQVKVI